MLKVGLTGGIGTGKSTVATMFRHLGAHTLDSDEIVHQLLEPGGGVYDAVVLAFGRGILTDDARIDRQALGRIVFADPERRRELNGLVHPAVGRLQEVFLEKTGQDDPSGVAIVDAALMIETGSFRRYDRIVVVRCSPEQQRQRLVRRGMAADEIERRIAAQMPLEEKLAYADHVIDNSGPISETRGQVEAVWQALRAAGGSLRD